MFFRKQRPLGAEPKNIKTDKKKGLVAHFIGILRR